MTEQEFSDLFDEDEVRLLDELGQDLRSGPELDLPADFARQTARAAEERLQRLSGLKRLALKLEPVLSSSVVSVKAFPYAVVLLGATVGAGLGGQQAVANLGPALLLLILAWKLLERALLPSLGTGLGPQRAVPTSWFYVLPAIASLLTATVCGLGINGLVYISIIFRTRSWDSISLGFLTALAVLLYLCSALLPTWRALKNQSVGRWRWLVSVQGTHAAWAGMLASLLGLIYEPKLSLVWLWGSLFTLALVVSFLLSTLPTEVEEGRPALWRAISKSLRSLFLGGLPIGATLVAAYQLSLTRAIEQPELCQATLEEVRQWVQRQQSIPSQENGWTELCESMTYRKEAKLALLEQMKAGSRLYEPENDSAWLSRPGSNQKWNAARSQFLQALPTIQSALQKPYFSYLSTQGFKYQALVPNFIAARAVSQGLAGLTGDAVRHGRCQEALNYELINLDWSRKMSQGSLISLMIAIAQEKIALDQVERWLFETHPNSQQLRRLLAGLQAAEFDHLLFQDTMKRELYLADLGFTELLEDQKDFRKIFEFNPDGGRLLLKLLPSSYWRSEHKAFVNLMLSNQEALAELGRPIEENPADLLPFSAAATYLAPATQRAQAQFMVSLGRFKALETVVALELFQREHGCYPDSLDPLVPAYLPELPRNVAAPVPWRRKPILEYEKQATKYILVARSTVFATVKMRERQQFGPDGVYQLEEAPRTDR